MNIMGISIVVRDLDVSVKYYTEVLGFKFFEKFRTGVGKSAVLTAGHVQVNLIESDKLPIGLNDFSIRSSDIEADIAKLKEKGANVVREPSVVGMGKLAQLKDPDGINFMVGEWNKTMEETETTVTEVL